MALPAARPSLPPTSPTVRWLFGVVVVFVLAMVAFRWDSQSGFTSLLRFGDDFAPRRLPTVAALPVASVSGPGYDGQFYAQLAVDPAVRQPEVQAALDAPAYRAQRILLPLLAHLAIRPWWILQTFALLNVVAWLIFARFWWAEVRELALTRAPLLWLAGVLSLGALDSVRLSLVDLPATLFILLAVRSARHMSAGGGGGAHASILLALAGLTRETALLAFPAADHPGALRRWLLRGLAALPALVWFVWLRWQLPNGGGFTGNFGWPGCALAEHLVRCGWELAHGSSDSRFLFGLLGAVGLAFQAARLLLLWLRAPHQPWLRSTIGFALLFWVLGGFVWNGYWAVARTCLPLTLAFNLTLPAGRGFWWRFALGNACALHAVYRLLPEY
ncbi:MAG: hypothetical protein IPL39_07960 [Opitutaceae bacterium]|nr:hypothetical protein [Opitutaceae bacterium]